MAETGLTESDRVTIARARQLAALPADGCTAYTGRDDPDLARAEVLGEAQYLLGELAAIAERRGGESGR
jgi:hypothetical protein